MVSGLAGEWVRDRRSAGSRDFLDSRSGLCEARSLIPTLRGHFLNTERSRGDSTLSKYPSGRVSKEEGADRASNCDIEWDGLDGVASSSQGPKEETGDSGSGNVNTEARDECNDYQPRRS